VPGLYLSRKSPLVKGHRLDNVLLLKAKEVRGVVLVVVVVVVVVSVTLMISLRLYDGKVK
jgi:hypothetical protein